jgi:hypothetical protein
MVELCLGVLLLGVWEVSILGGLFGAWSFPWGCLGSFRRFCGFELRVS